ncbi:hypothetical protein F2Q68_00009834 [Brassica cretica]|uniref:Uncharacterized protein n=1 Tax=Brassica cretica TaxID=69181 RepID=A0A8S9KQ54_BRACR|nr:hypothetical protein F2Q68_00009834 [Brassica cretica]
MEVVSSHLELYWRSYDRFTRGISTLTRVGPTRVPLPGREKRKLDERADTGRWTRVSLPGRPPRKLDEELTRVGRRGLRPWHLPGPRLYLGRKSTFLKVVSSHLELYWRSYDRFTRGISILTQVGPTRVPLPGREKRKLDERADAGRWTRVSLPGWPTRSWMRS